MFGFCAYFFSWGREGGATRALSLPLGGGVAPTVIRQWKQGKQINNCLIVVVAWRLRGARQQAAHHHRARTQGQGLMIQSYQEDCV